MTRRLVLAALLCLLLWDSAISAQTQESYGKLPLSFEANRGQTDAQVKFFSRGSGYTLFLTSTEAVLSLRKPQAKTSTVSRQPLTEPDILERTSANVFRIELVGANPAPQVEGLDDLPGKSNYFLGNDPTQWRTSVPTFAKVKYRGVYPGIDLVYYGREKQFEFDFLVSPGADPSRIQFAIEGANCLEVDDHGDLVMHASASQAKPERASTTNCRESRSSADQVVVRLRKPDVYQGTSGARHKITGHYLLLASSRVGFALAPFDHTKSLCIDPVLEYSTYLGGADDDSAQGIAVDANGNMYIAGTTRSTNFPTSHPFQSAPASFIDVFVTKLNAAGDTLIYSTYLGGTNSDDARAIAIDELGNAYIAGTTLSTDFPTASPLQPAYGGGFQDAFLTKLNPDGSALIYSTYLGGSGADLATSLAVDTSHNVYLTGFTDSSNFPTANAAQSTLGGAQDAFVSKVNPAGSALLYSTYLGGSSADQGFGITVDSQGNAYVTGRTTSTDFPVATGAFQPTYNGTGALGDAFVSKLAASGSSLVFSTFLGGSGSDVASSIALDTQGNVYVTGSTGSTDFPITPGAFRSACHSNCDSVDTDAFVTKLNPTGTALVYSTYLGGNYGDSGTAIFADHQGITYVAGVTKSSDFPTANAIQSTCSGSSGTIFECNADAFLSKLTANGSHLIFSTFLGGGNNDMASSLTAVPPGAAYLAGQTQSGNFPTAHPFQATFAGGVLGDAFVAKISGLALSFPTTSRMNIDFSSQVVSTTSAAQTITLTNEGDATLNISSIAASAEYAQTNSCAATLAPAANCAISVTFAPAATGFRPGTLIITDDATGGPQSVSLTGIGTTAPGDFDRDGKADFAVFRPSSGTWFIIPSSNPSVPIIRQWGTLGDIAVSGDYDGDGKADFAVFRPSSGTWFIIPSSNPSVPVIRQWGTLGDIPLPGDYDGDGKTDFAVWRPSTGTWFIIPSSNPSVPAIQQWGTLGDIPVPGDYDGDRKTDIAVWRPSNGEWFIIPSSAPSTFTITQWGANGDIPVPGDYDGDRKTDIAVWRPSSGDWFTIPSSAPSTFTITQWGTNGDVPVQKPVGQ